MRVSLARLADGYESFGHNIFERYLCPGPTAHANAPGTYVPGNCSAFVVMMVSSGGVMVNDYNTGVVVNMTDIRNTVHVPENENPSHGKSVRRLFNPLVYDENLINHIIQHPPVPLIQVICIIVAIVLHDLRSISLL
jgi:hypothetical protein